MTLSDSFHKFAVYRTAQHNKMIKEFGIPLNKDDLLKNNSVKYSVNELLPIRGIQQAVDGEFVIV